MLGHSLDGFLIAAVVKAHDDSTVGIIAGELLEVLYKSACRGIHFQAAFTTTRPGAFPASTEM